MIRRFMYGRNGMDPFNLVLLIAAVVLSFLNNILYILLRAGILYALLSMVDYLLVFFFLYRMLSRNLPKRHAENQKWMSFWTRLRDRNNCYFRCPQCKQRVRVPRHKGKISIRCPKCGERFIRKT